jgi:hypothetical protein
MGRGFGVGDVQARLNGRFECNGLISSIWNLQSIRSKFSPMKTPDWTAFAINLFILAIPAIMLLVAWKRLVGDWRDGVVQGTAGTASLLFASGSTIVALGSLLWQLFVRPIARHDYRAEVTGLLLSVAGVITSFLTRGDHENQYWPLGLAAAGWMFFWFVATAFSY